MLEPDLRWDTIGFFENDLDAPLAHPGCEGECAAVKEVIDPFAQN